MLLASWKCSIMYKILLRKTKGKITRLKSPLISSILSANFTLYTPSFFLFTSLFRPLYFLTSLLQVCSTNGMTSKPKNKKSGTNKRVYNRAGIEIKPAYLLPYTRGPKTNRNQKEQKSSSIFSLPRTRIHVKMITAMKSSPKAIMSFVTTTQWTAWFTKNQTPTPP